MKSGKIQNAVLVGLALALSACGVTGESIRLGDQRHEYEVIELGSVVRPEIRVEMGAGNLWVSGGANELMEADFIYNVAALEPEINVSGERVSILTPETRLNFDSLFDLDDYRYDWDLRFNNELSMRMEISLGWGEANLALGALNLERLDLDSGAGALDLSLVGSNVEILNLDAGVGEVRVDLGGEWTQDLSVRIDTGVGELTLILPRRANVSVEVDGGLVDLNVEGFTRSDGRFTHQADDATAAIDVRIDAGVGEINLLLAE